MDASLTRLETARDDLARRWLARVVERSSLDEVAALSNERVVRRIPALVSAVVEAAGEPEAPSRRGAVERAAELLAGVRGEGPVAPAVIARDAATLESAIAEQLADDESGRTLRALSRVSAALFEAVGSALSTRSSEQPGGAASAGGLDPLTGLLDAPSLRRQLAQFVAIQQRYDHPFAVLVIDLDGLRRVNDAHGREAGDRALAAVSAAVRRSVRAADGVGRLRGDELCVLAPHQTAAGGRVIGERLARVAGREAEAVTVSIGVAGCPEHGVEVDGLLERADEALYRCKAAGTAVEVADTALARAAQADGL